MSIYAWAGHGLIGSRAARHLCIYILCDISDKVCVTAITPPIINQLLRRCIHGRQDEQEEWAAGFLDVARPPSRDPPPGDRLPGGIASLGRT
eukprot:1176176-Prorocentrum_minimum.AAC.2